jgi:hypothetical protein
MQNNDDDDYDYVDTWKVCCLALCASRRHTTTIVLINKSYHVLTKCSSGYLNNAVQG